MAKDEETGSGAQSRQSAKLFLLPSELGLPHPSPAGRGKERESGWGSPNSDEGTYTVKKDVQSQYAITLLVDSAFTLNIYDFIFFRPIFPARVNFLAKF